MRMLQHLFSSIPPPSVLQLQSRYQQWPVCNPPWPISLRFLYQFHFPLQSPKQNISPLSCKFFQSRYTHQCRLSFDTLFPTWHNHIEYIDKYEWNTHYNYTKNVEEHQHCKCASLLNAPRNSIGRIIWNFSQIKTILHI